MQATEREALEKRDASEHVLVFIHVSCAFARAEPTHRGVSPPIAKLEHARGTHPVGAGEKLKMRSWRREEVQQALLQAVREVSAVEISTDLF